MKKENYPALVLIGLAWPFFGLGYLSLEFHYLPDGLPLATQAVGLFVAGFLSGLVLLSVMDNMKNKLSRAMIVIGYLLFAPLGLMAGLIAPGAYEPVEMAGSFTFALIAPMMMMIIALVSVGLGMGFTGGLAAVAHKLVARR